MGWTHSGCDGETCWKNDCHYFLCLLAAGSWRRCNCIHLLLIGLLRFSPVGFYRCWHWVPLFLNVQIVRVQPRDIPCFLPGWFLLWWLWPCTEGWWVWSSVELSAPEPYGCGWEGSSPDSSLWSGGLGVVSSMWRRTLCGHQWVPRVLGPLFLSV